MVLYERAREREREESPGLVKLKAWNFSKVLSCLVANLKKIFVEQPVCLKFLPVFDVFLWSGCKRILRSTDCAYAPRIKSSNFAMLSKLCFAWTCSLELACAGKEHSFYVSFKSYMTFGT